MANAIKVAITEIEFKGGQKKAVDTNVVVTDGLLFIESGDGAELVPLVDVKSVKVDEDINDVLEALNDTGD